METKLARLTADIEETKQLHADAKFELADTQAQKREREAHIEVLLSEAAALKDQVATLSAFAAEKELQVNQLNERADWLFSSAVAHHGNLLSYELSFLGRCPSAGGDAAFAF